MGTRIHLQDLLLACIVVFNMKYGVVLSCSCSVDNLHELGVEDGHIPDLAITASSTLDDNHGPGRGRLNQGPTGSQGTAWCAKESNADQYLQVDLTYTSKVTHIATQGQNDPPDVVNGTNITSWVKEYKLEYSSDGQTYSTYYFQKDIKMFDGNTDGFSVSCCELPYPLVVRYLRFRPVSWEKRICLRVGVYGVGNVTALAQISENEIAFHEYWWWPLFWVLVIFLIFLVILAICFYRRIRKRLSLRPRQSKVEKKRPSFYTNPVVPKSQPQRNGTVTIVMQDVEKKPDSNPYEIPEDEVQEVVAHFTDDGFSNKHGVTHFSVADEDEDESPVSADKNQNKPPTRQPSYPSQNVYETVR